MKVLAVSDVEVGIIYSTAIRERFKDAHLAVSCGDLPLDYLEYIMSSLDIPMYFVFGNHAHTINNREKEYEPGPWGAINLNGQVYRDETGLLLAGVEGCLQYNYGPHQYSQWEMWVKVFSLIPKLVYNRLRFGRYLDIFITHAPPWKVHDQPDLPHRGIKAFRWFDQVFQPAYHLHGHIHIYHNKTPRDTLIKGTRILNVFGYKEIEIQAVQNKRKGEKK